MSATRKQVANEARSWIGTPWRHQALVKDAGCDCIGLIRGVGVMTGAFRCDPSSLAVKCYEGYSREPNPRVMRRALYDFLTPIKVEDATTGDILWFRIELDPMHLGIFVESKIVVHACTVAGRVIEHGLDKSWRDRTVAAFRFPNLIVEEPVDE